MTAPKPRLEVDATRDRLRTLGCGYAAERLGELLGEAVRAEIAPHAFLEQLLAAELSGREAVSYTHLTLPTILLV